MSKQQAKSLIKKNPIDIGLLTSIAPLASAPGGTIIPAFVVGHCLRRVFVPLSHLNDLSTADNSGLSSKMQQGVVGAELEALSTRIAMYKSEQDRVYSRERQNSANDGCGSPEPMMLRPGDYITHTGLLIPKYRGLIVI